MIQLLIFGIKGLFCSPSVLCICPLILIVLRLRNDRASEHCTRVKNLEMIGGTTLRNKTDKTRQTIELHLTP